MNRGPWPNLVTALDVLACPPERRVEALEVLYRRMPDSLRSRLAVEAARDAESGRLDLSGLWVGLRRGRVIAAVLTQRLGTRAAAIWPPEVTVLWGRRAVGPGLVRAALAGLRREGARVVQATLEPALGRGAAWDLVRGGLRPVTKLTYLVRKTHAPVEVPAGAPRLRWSAFSVNVRDVFREVLEATYRESLDMPELAGARGLEDLLDIHRVSGTFDPGLWWVGQVPNEPDSSAILLLTASKERATWEVAYLGLTPAARRRGLGRAVIARAVELARPHATQLELAVDSRNLPARRLYHATDFVPYDRRTIYLAILERDGPAP